MRSAAGRLSGRKPLDVSAVCVDCEPYDASVGCHLLSVTDLVG